MSHFPRSSSLADFSSKSSLLRSPALWNPMRKLTMRYKKLILVVGLCLCLLTIVCLSHASFAGSILQASRTRLTDDLLNGGYANTPVVSGMEALGAVKRPGTIFGIVFDAGSTGSRVHVYELKYNPKNTQPYTLESELFQQVKPGLSAYADDTLAAARSLEPLMEAAKRKIPLSHWKETNMALRATAGLRLLPGETAQHILDQVSRYLSTQPFHLVTDGVTILDGLDEGVFSWITLNFLTDSLSPSLSLSSKKTFGALDLGGGSTQITVLPTKDSATLHTSPDGFLRECSLAGGTRIKLYTHSYLGLGLMSARLGIMTGGEPTEGRRLTSECLPKNYQGSWKHGGHTYSVSGNPDVPDAYLSCLKASDHLIKEHFHVHRPAEVTTHTFYAFSYFYDRAADANLIERDLGGRITLGDFKYAAQHVCENPTASNPFLCMDLCYITSLLKTGYHFVDSTTFILQKKINSVELSWGLGAMFDLLSKPS